MSWPLERVLFAIAGTVLIGGAMRLVSPWFLLLIAFVASTSGSSSWPRLPDVPILTRSSSPTSYLSMTHRHPPIHAPRPGPTGPRLGPIGRLGR